jgi:hypothetical protein
MSNLTYLYQALANARAVVTDLERAIQAETNRSTPTGYTGTGYSNADTNGNYRRDFYEHAERDAIDP